MRDAVRVGDAAAVAELLQANIDLALSQPEDRGPTPLHWAASHGHAAICELLLVHPGGSWACVTQADADGQTPLHVASARGDSAVVAVVLANLPGRVKPAMVCGLRDAKGMVALQVRARLARGISDRHPS